MKMSFRQHLIVWTLWATLILGSIPGLAGTTTTTSGPGTLNAANLTGTVPISKGGTNATTEADARTNRGLAIGTNVQAYDADLTALAGMGDPGADRVVFWDESANTFTYLTMGTNLTITDTTLAAAGGGFWEHVVITGEPRHDGTIKWNAVSGTWIFSVPDVNQRHGGVLMVAVPANTDQVEKANIRVPVDGTYALRAQYTENTDGGIAKVRWDGAQKATIDSYGASLVYNKWSAAIDLGALTANTGYTLNFLIDAKNGSSSGYSFQIDEVHIYRTL